MVAAAAPKQGNFGVFRLQAADVLLVHTKRSLWGWLIRRGTRCYWNHALMVYSPADREADYADSLAIDAKTDGTIVFSRVSEYISRPDKYDLAVKRLETDWFQGDQTNAFDFRGHICNVAVNEVDIKVGIHLMNGIDKALRQFIVILRFIRRKLGKAYIPPKLPWNIRPIQVKAFTCGGFVQWCYYKGLMTAAQQRRMQLSLLPEVVFNPRVKGEPTPFELLTTTPADLANCSKLSLKYTILNGTIREISGPVDAAPVGTFA